ncbi:MAG: alpha/beta hydrolase [Acidimicrobiales bacterium]
MAIEPLELRAEDGPVLEAELSVSADPWAAVVLAHPHPTRGGNMRSLVTGALFSALPAGGVATLRFNFRGVEGSTGTHDGGVGEQRDILAGIDALAGITEGLPLALSGWSFGADTSLAVVDSRLSGWAPVAPPLRILDPDTMGAAADPRPKCFVIASNDQFRTPEAARPILAGWANVEMHVVEGADHFFVGRTDRVAEIVLTWLRSLA